MYDWLLTKLYDHLEFQSGYEVRLGIGESWSGFEVNLIENSFGRHGVNDDVI